jgi:hypothetical protein
MVKSINLSIATSCTVMSDREQRKWSSQGWMVAAGAGVAVSATLAVFYYAYTKLKKPSRKNKPLPKVPKLKIKDDDEDSPKSHKRQLSSSRVLTMQSPTHRHALSSEELILKLRESQGFVEQNRLEINAVQQTLRLIRGAVKYYKDYPLNVRLECVWVNFPFLKFAVLIGSIVVDFLLGYEANQS